MPFVTVKPKFQVTIPAKLRSDVNLHDGAPLEAVIIGDGILFRPMGCKSRIADQEGALVQTLILRRGHTTCR